MIEARATPRINVSWRADVLFESAPAIPVKVVDVSEGGLGFTADSAFGMNQEVHLRLAIPSPSNPGRVRHDVVVGHIRYQVLKRGQYSVGVQFSRIDHDTRSLIRQRVTANMMPAVAMPSPILGDHQPRPWL